METLYRIKINQNKIKQHSKICHFDGTINENLESIIILFYFHFGVTMSRKTFGFLIFKHTQKNKHTIRIVGLVISCGMNLKRIQEKKNHISTT